jgi:hypothetical protein
LMNRGLPLQDHRPIQLVECHNPPLAGVPLWAMSVTLERALGGQVAREQWGWESGEDRQNQTAH